MLRREHVLGRSGPVSGATRVWRAPLHSWGEAERKGAARRAVVAVAQTNRFVLGWHCVAFVVVGQSRRSSAADRVQRGDATGRMVGDRVRVMTPIDFG